MLPTDLPANPNPGFASWQASPPPLPPAPPQIPLQSPPSPSFFAKNKKPLILAGILLVIFAVGGFAGMKFLIKKPSAPEVAQKPQVPQIFVAEQVISAEKKDLTSFFTIWREAKARQASFDECEQLALGKAGRFENIPVLKIGNETLYGNDLNYRFLFYNFQDFTTAIKIPEEKLNEAVDQAIADSVILQEAIKQNLLTSSDEFFNRADKNYTLRNEKINLAKKALSDKIVQKISGEAVSIWFQNLVVPISVESGKPLAKAKMDKIYEKLKKGEITSKEASELIIKDTEIGQKIDPAWKANAYFVFENIEKGEPIFNIENLNQEAWSLGEGQMSPVILGKDEKEFLYTIIKINKRTGEINQTETTDQLIENLVNQIPKQNLSL